MRARLAFIVVAIVIAGALAVQNWPEFTRSAPLGLGPFNIDMPLGLLLLGLLALALAAFLISAATQESRHLFEHRRHARVLNQQRDLAEKAEASRFTDLRQALDNHLRETRQRDTEMATDIEKRMMVSHRELRAQIEQMHHMMATRLAELESRLGARPVVPEPPPVVATDRATRDTVRL